MPATVPFSLCVLVLVSTISAAQAGAPRADAVHVAGCPVQLDANCVVILDARGTPYDITGAPPQLGVRGDKAAPPNPAGHLGIELDGIVAEGELGRCRRGVALRDIHWRYTKTKCPASAVKP